MIVRTYRSRLALLFAVIVTVVCCLFVVGFYFAYRHELVRGLERKLENMVKTDALFAPDGSPQSGDVEVVKRVEGGYFHITFRSGKAEIRSPDDAGLRWPLNMGLVDAAFRNQSTFETVMQQDERFLILYAPAQKDRIVRVGASLEEIDRTLRRLVRLSLLFIPLALAGSLTGGWLVSGRAILPIMKTAALAEELRQGKFEGPVTVPIQGREIRILEEKLTALFETIHHFVEAQKLFTSYASHELRSPLTSLRGSMEVTLMKKRSLEEYEELLRSNLADVLRLAKFIDDLLFCIRADSNMLEFRKQWIDVGLLLNTAVERMRLRADAGGLTFAEDYSGNLELFADNDLLGQAFSNLLENAEKYSPSGGLVTVAASGSAEKATVTITDNGVGIAPDDIPHVFERFYRGRMERSKTGGSGLGLAIAQWVIRAHDGSIAVSSSGTGTTFTVILPKTRVKTY